MALTWAGIEHSWTSAAVLAPLIIGLAGLVAFVLFDAKIAKEPLIPFKLLGNRTTIIGYMYVQLLLEGNNFVVVLYLTSGARLGLQRHVSHCYPRHHNYV